MARLRFPDMVQVRSILVMNPALKGVDGFTHMMHLRHVSSERYGAGPEKYAFVTVRSHTPPPGYMLPYVREVTPRKRDGTTTQDATYSYPVCVAETTVGDSRGLLIASPVRSVLGDARPSEATLLYTRCDLAALCDRHFGEGADPAFSVTRLNAKIAGEEAENARSVTLYGANVLRAATLRGLLESLSIRVDHPPFRELELQIGPRFIVNSCRLTFDMANRRVHVSIDRFGNFAFSYRGEDTLEGASIVLRYLESVKALVVTKVDPLKRSERLLKLVEA